MKTTMIIGILFVISGFVASYFAYRGSEKDKKKGVKHNELHVIYLARLIGFILFTLIMGIYLIFK